MVIDAMLTVDNIMPFIMELGTLICVSCDCAGWDFADFRRFRKGNFHANVGKFIALNNMGIAD
jgi:hypothetical protein